MMNYYDDGKNVEDYIKMADGYDGRELIDLLREHLPAGSTVLELGMGPGTDLDLLAEHFQVTGSDRSAIFVERYRVKHPEADLLQLDAVTLETDRHFDCIYSNKVLHHLTRAEMVESFRRQAALLNGGGLLCHSFWTGDQEEEMHGMHFAYYTEETLAALLGDDLEWVEAVQYAEMEEGDSLCALLKKRDG